jgi:ABC-type multidrug transport system fused ATPase/permease subunit
VTEPLTEHETNLRSRRTTLFFRRAWRHTAPGASVGKERLSARQLLQPFIQAHRRRFVIALTAAFLAGLAEAGALVLLARIAVALTTGEAVSASVAFVDVRNVSIPVLIAIAVAFVVAKFVFQVIQSRQMVKIMTLVMIDERRSIVHAFLRSSWDVQSKEREGRVQDLVMTNVAQTASIVSTYILGLTSLLNLIALALAAVFVSPVGAIAVAVAGVVLSLILRPVRSITRQRAKRATQSNTELATGVAELAGLALELRAFDVGDAAEHRIDALVENHASRAAATRFVSSMAPAIYQLIAVLFMLFALGLMDALDLTQVASLGAVVLLLLRSLSYGQTVQSALGQIQESAPFLETVRMERSRYEDAGVSRSGAPFDRIDTLEFDRVSFEYEAGRPVLKDLEFHVSRGEIIGIVGPSGAGKSTLVQLLLRFREPTHGRICADGSDVRLLAIDQWHRRLAFVPQDLRLINGTIAENIRFMRSTITDAEVEQAARLAHLHDEIMSWPSAYATPVGVRGGQLSGGQRQRLCIARGLAGNPDVLVLDEPTSALDPRSESLVRETIAGLRSTKTTFVVAHRLSTLDVCDRIMVLQHGELQAFDEPSRLEASSDFYREALRLSGLR